MEHLILPTLAIVILAVSVFFGRRLERLDAARVSLSAPEPIETR